MAIQNRISLQKYGTSTFMADTVRPIIPGLSTGCSLLFFILHIKLTGKIVSESHI
jgi:hypothetical protein